MCGFRVQKERDAVWVHERTNERGAYQEYYQQKACIEQSVSANEGRYQGPTVLPEVRSQLRIATWRKVRNQPVLISFLRNTGISEMSAKDIEVYCAHFQIYGGFTSKKCETLKKKELSLMKIH